MREKKHCCCCVPLPDGVMLVGIYGSAFHTGLLIIQMTHGASLAPDPQLLHPPFAAELVRLMLLAAHLLGILVNLLLLCGMYWGHRRLMLPWLFLQGFLASILASLACYYLILFPLKNSCISEVENLLYYQQPKKDANFRPLIISSTSFEEDASSTYQHSCQPLLWYSAIMILSLLILFYYFYIVNDFLDQLKAEKKREKALWKIDIELQRSEFQQEDEGDNDEPVVVLDDSAVPNNGTTSESSTIKQVTFNTTSGSSPDQSSSSPEVTLPPKKTSRVVWQEHVEVME